MAYLSQITSGMKIPVKLSAVQGEAMGLFFALERLILQIEHFARLAGADLSKNKGYQDALAAVARIEAASTQTEIRT